MTRIYCIAEKIFAVFGAIVFAVIVWFIVAAMWRAPLHQFNLWTLQKNFRAIEQPLNSKSIKKLSGFGRLFRDASNGCDYLVGGFRVGNDTRESIAQWYQDFSIRPFDDAEPVPIEIKFFDDEDFSEGRQWSNPWFDWYEKIRESFDWQEMRGTPYVVFARQTDYPPYGDIRCFYEPAIH